MFDSTRQYELRIMVNNKYVDEYPHNDGYVYVEGRAQSKFSIKIVNWGHEKIMACPSVDGLSIFDGKPAGLNSKGYVLGPRYSDSSSIIIPGWTIDINNVAEFLFNDAKESYNAKMSSNPTNIGVIGLMVFREKKHINTSLRSVNSINLNDVASQLLSPPGGGWTCSSGSWAASASNTSDTLVSNSLGTDWGSKVDFLTKEVSFEKRDPNYPDSIMALFYDDARGLERRGIRLKNKSYGRPNPFPSYNTGCTPPPGWKG